MHPSRLAPPPSAASGLRHRRRRHSPRCPVVAASTETLSTSAPPPAHAPRVVVTGGTSGLGLALALALLRRGCRVLVTGRDAGRAADARAAGVDDVLEGLDAGSAEDVARLGAEVEARLGGVDLWLNNAGLASRVRRPLWLQPEEDVEEAARTNVSGESCLLGWILDVFG